MLWVQSFLKSSIGEGSDASGMVLPDHGLGISAVNVAVDTRRGHFLFESVKE